MPLKKSFQKTVDIAVGAEMLPNPKATIKLNEIPSNLNQKCRIKEAMIAAMRSLDGLKDNCSEHTK